MSQDLLLTQNAQFYRPRAPFTKVTLTAILDAASSNMTIGSTLIADILEQNDTLSDGSKFSYSLRVFKTDRDVHFWQQPLKDTIYAFILIIAIDDCIAIFKKSCASITESMDKHAKLIRSSELTSAFSDIDAQYQKMATRNMTVSDRAMRGRAFEASDLKGLMSVHAAGRSIPYFFKLKLKGRTKTISAQSGRVVEASDRKSIHHAVEWVRVQLHDINNPSTEKDFLNNFAKFIDLDLVWKSSTPNAVLLEHSFFVENVINQGIPIFYTTRRGREIEMTSKHVKSLIAEMEQVYEVGPAPDHELLGSIRQAKLKKNLHSIAVNSRALQNIHFEQNGKKTTLQAYIKKQSLATITFSDPRYMYFMDQCFEDGAGINEIPAMLRTLKILPELASATSEKGKITKKITKFDSTSVFDIVETAHNADDYVFCDDLGNEWADHITFNRADYSVSFIHSKHGKPSKSASNLHDVVGQAIKNIGNMEVDPKLFLKKHKEKFRKNYNYGLLKRTRKSIPGKFEDYLYGLRQDYRFNRRCIICCSFISKKTIEKEFKKIQKGISVAGNITQLYWILSSFMHAAKEAGIHPIVYCQE